MIAISPFGSRLFSWYRMMAGIFLLLAICPSSLPAATTLDSLNPVITSAAEFDYPPFSLVSPDGSATGFSVELLQASLKAMGYKVSFQVGPWPEVKQSLIDRRVQVLPLVGRTPEREKNFDFTVPYLNMHGTIIVRDAEHNIHDLVDLKGRTVAVLKGDNAEEFLRRSSLDANIITTESFEAALLELSQGQYDAVVIQKLLAIQLIRKNSINNLRPVGPPLEKFVQSFCFAVPKGEAKLLGILNEGLSLVIADGTFQELRAKWFSSLESIPKSRLVVGGDENYPPYEYLDENGQPEGFNVDLTQAIAKQLGLQIEIQLDSWNKVRQGLDEGQIDLIQGMFYSAERDKLVDFSTAYQIVGHSIISRAGEDAPRSLSELAGKSILVMEGDIMHDVALQQGYESQLFLIKSQEEALRRLAAGQQDCALMARIPALYWINKHKWDNLVVGSELILSPEYCYAAVHGSETLLAKISDALAILKQNGEYRRIYSKWFSAYEPSGPDTKLILVFILIGASPVVLVVLGAIYWNKSLKREVKQRTFQLEAEIGDREKAEKVLQAEEKKFRTLFEHVSDYALVLRQAGDDLIIVDLSESACRQHGYQRNELLGQSLNLLDQSGINLEDFGPRMAKLNSGDPLHLEAVHRRKDGSTFPIEAFVKMIHIGGEQLLFSIERDLTQRKKADQEKIEMELQLRQKHKMEAVGIMAGGMAHNFNNNLAIILGNLELTRFKLGPDTQEHENLDHALIAARRASELIRQIMTYSHQGQHKEDIVPLDRVVDETLKMLRSTIPTTIDLEYRVPKENPSLTIKADQSRIQEALINLCNNAVHAMSEKGLLTFSLELVELEGKDIPVQYPCPPGRYVRLNVADTGCGMTSETLEKIFDPFFTTKDVGEGTGIGLSTVQGIMQQHEGLIKVHSYLGQGTTFELFFPLAGQKATETLLDRSNPFGGNEKILFVDDEEMITRLWEKTLSEMGYQITAETSSHNALERIKNAPNSFDLVITDQTMPKLTGKDLARNLHQIRPELPVILCTGYSAGLSQTEANQLGISAFCMKPLEMSTLLKTIRAVLDAKSEQNSIVV